MSRENRMLVMFVVGMVVLFTVFRIQFPNLGRVDELRPAERTPLLRVRGEPELLERLEKASRSYELEFGVRILLGGGDMQSPEVTGAHLWVGWAGAVDPRSEPLVHRFSVPKKMQSPGPEDFPTIVIGIIESDLTYQQGAARFARYLLAEDRGFPLIHPEGSAGGRLDAWQAEPEPSLVVPDRLYPIFRDSLEAFEALEGIRFRLVVGNCALVAWKMGEQERVDGLLVDPTSCPLPAIGKGWRIQERLPLRLSLLSSMLESEETKPAELVLVRGTRSSILEMTADSGLADWRGRLEEGRFIEVNRMRDVQRKIANEPGNRGLILSPPAMEWTAGLRRDPVDSLSKRPGVQLVVSDSSLHPHLLARLGKWLAGDRGHLTPLSNAAP